MKKVALSKKVIFVFSLFSFLVISLVGFNLYNSIQLRKNNHQMDVLSRQMQMYNNFAKEAILTNLDYMDSIVDKDMTFVEDDIKDQHQKFYKDFASIKEIYQSSLSTNEEKADFLKTIEDIKALKLAAESVFNLIETRGSSEDFAKYDDILDGTLDRILDRNNVVLESKQQEFNKLSAQNDSLSQFVQKAQYISLGLTVILSLIMAIYLVTSINKSLRSVVHKLNENFKVLLDQSRKISLSSTSLSEASTQQAAGVQETVSSIDEISMMVDRNADTAERSTKISAHSKQIADDGKQTVQQMIDSIAKIVSSNEKVMGEIHQTNDDFSRVVDVINQIGQKTQVIHDIVFQTKLLSFNASVEAARAGEHGKGFAVVAEEVGNLASMSGKAAQEIKDLLDQSVKQVQEIVDDSRSKIENMAGEFKQKIEIGENKAKECGESLDEILNNVVQVNDLVKEIAHASQEQALGVREVTVAMQQLDAVAHQNNLVAKDSSLMAESLATEANTLHGVIELLTQLAGIKTTSLKVDNLKTQRDHNNIVDFQKLKNTHKSEKQELSSFKNKKVLKQVSGEVTSIPDANDPGFEDL